MRVKQSRAVVPVTAKPGPRLAVSRVLPAKAILEISLTAGRLVSWQGSRSAPRIAPMSCSGSEKRARKAGGAVTTVGDAAGKAAAQQV